jgi:hypothetical protein
MRRPKAQHPTHYVNLSRELARICPCKETHASTFEGQGATPDSRKENPMAYRTMIVLAATAAIGVASFSSDAFAWRGGVGYHGGAGWRGGAGWHGAYARPGWRPGVGAAVGAAAVGAAAVGAAAASPYYYNRAACGYYPNPPCY